MVKLITWDIWAAAALALAVALAGPTPAAFIVIFVGLCAYVVVQTIKGEPR
jgi:hypothetical protein